MWSDHLLRENKAEREGEGETKYLEQSDHTICDQQSSESESER